jgi:hypothetical protein
MLVLSSSCAILPWPGPLEVPAFYLGAYDLFLVRGPVLPDGIPGND